MTLAWITLLAAPLLLLPGWVIWRLAGPRGLHPALQVTPAFGLSMAVMSLIAWSSFVLGIGFSGVRAIALAVLALALIASPFALRWRREAEAEPAVPAWAIWAGVAIAAAAMLCAVYSGPWMSLTADSFYHLASIRSVLAHGTALPQEVFFSTPVSRPDPTSGTWQVALAVIASLSGEDPMPLWRVATVLMAPLAVLAFFTLVLTVARNALAAVIGTALYALLALSFDFRAAAYPNHFGLLLGWLALAFVIRFARSGARRELAMAAPIAFAASAVHPALSPFLLTTLFCGLAAAIVIRSASAARFAIAAAIVGAAALPLLIVNLATLNAPAPYAAMAQVAFPLRVVHHPYTWVWPGFWYYDAGTIFGTVFAVFLVRLWRAGEIGAGLVGAALVAIPAAGLIPYFASTYSGQYALARVADVVEPLAWLAWGWGLAIVLLSARGRLRVPAAALVIVSVLATLPALYVGPVERILPGHPLKSFSITRSGDLTIAWSDRLEALSHLPPSAVVLAHPDTAYEIAGLTGREVVAVPLTHTPAQVEVIDGPGRRADTLDALYGRLSPADLAGVLEHYNVAAVLVDLEGENPRALQQLARAQILVPAGVGDSGNGWRLYRYDPAQLDAYLDLDATAIADPGLLRAGAGPQQVLAGRAAFARVQWGAGVRGTVGLRADSDGSGSSFSRSIEASAAAGATSTFALPVPLDAAAGLYRLSLTMPGGRVVTLGGFAVGRLFQAEDMGGVVAGDSRGWTVVSGSDYQGGLAASAFNEGSVAQQPIPPVAAGIYCLAARVLDDGTDRSNVLDLSLGTATRTINWSGGTPGLRWLRYPVTLDQAAGRLGMRVVQRKQAVVIVDALEVYPLVAGACASDSPALTNT